MTIPSRLARRLLLLALAAGLACAIPAAADAAITIASSDAVPGLAWATTTSAVCGSTCSTVSGTFAATDDGGATWTPSRVGMVVGADPALRWAPGGGGGVIASTDAGASWHALPSFTALLARYAGTVVTPAVLQLLADPVRAGVVYAIINEGLDRGSFQGVAESTDGGITWNEWKAAIGQRGGTDSYIASAPVPGRDALLVERMTSRPRRRDVLALATPSATAVIGGLALSKVPGYGVWTGEMEVDRRGGRVLLGTHDRGWYLSTDGGTHLHRLGQADAALDPAGGRGLFALRGGRILHSADDGKHWVRRGHVAGATGIAVDRGGRLLYVFGGTQVAVSRDAGATSRSLGAFVGAMAVGTAPQLIAAGDVVTGSLPGSGLPDVVDQAPHAGHLAAAPTGDAIATTGGTTIDFRRPGSGWRNEPFAGVTDNFPAMDANGVAYLAGAIDDTAFGTGISYRIALSSHAPGGIWTPSVAIATVTSQVDGRQWVAVDGAGDLLVVWETAGLWGTVLRAGAASWSAPVEISGDDVVPNLDELAVVGGGNGTFVVAWDAVSPLTALGVAPRTARLESTGAWTPPVDPYPLPAAAFATVAQSSFIVDGAGTALLLAPTATGPQSFTWAPDAAAWTSGVPVAPPAGQADAYGQPALALGTDGTATAVYTHADTHELALRASTSRAPYTAWTPDAKDVALAETCPAGDCLTLAPPTLTYAPCGVVCVADGAPPTVASVASRTVASLETSRGLLVAAREPGSDGWRTVRTPAGAAGTIALTAAVRNSVATVRVSCAAAPCLARIVIETAPGSPLGDRVHIAARTTKLPGADAVTRTLALPAWAQTALTRDGSLPVRLVLETGDGDYADPIGERDDVLRAGA